MVVRLHLALHMLTLLISSIAGFIFASYWEYFCARIIKRTSFILFGWRLHHSLYGILFIAIGFSVRNMSLIGIGIGVLIQHTITDGFRFISKEHL